MSKSGAPALSAPKSDLSVAVISTQWHLEIVDSLVKGAVRACRQSGISPTLVQVPGTVELSVTAARLAPRFDALVALGVVIRGGTPHFEYVCQSVTQGLTHVSVTTGRPVGFGVLTCNTVDEALERCGLPTSSEDKGYEAAVAAIATAHTLRELENEAPGLSRL